MATRPLADLPTWLLSRANRRAQGLLYDAFAEVGLRPVHYRTLAALADGGSLSQAELGRRLGLDRKDVAVTLDQLADRRLLRRRPDPDDGRRNVITLTTTGLALLPDLERRLDAVQQEVLAPLSANERRTLQTLLRRLGPTDSRDR